jgi:tagaturonate reductase
MLPETILQFGTGKFLRAFADLFVYELNEGPEPIGRVVVVQSTGVERAAAWSAQDGRYHVAIRGLSEGRTIDRTIEVRSVSRALAAQSDWQEVLRLARSPSLRLVISNVTEAGYQLEPEDGADDAPPRSFPAKLLAVLAARFESGLPGLTILPCELLEQNAKRLRQLVLDQAERWKVLGPLFDWLDRGCQWPSTLVDRIVSAPPPGIELAERDQLYAVAEPYALWLVEGQSPPDSADGQQLLPSPVRGRGAGGEGMKRSSRELAARRPLSGLEAHPAVQQVDRLEPYYLRKVRILNGAHTALVAKAIPLGFTTVRQAVLDPQIGGWLRRLLFEEIVPVLEGRTENPEPFARQTLERFANPFLEHRLADIALHHEVKLQTRLVPTYHEFIERFGREPPLLAEIVVR